MLAHCGKLHSRLASKGCLHNARGLVPEISFLHDAAGKRLWLDDASNVDRYFHIAHRTDSARTPL